MKNKSFKVRDNAGRVAFVELLVDKRVRFLEYLRELHQSEMLWMGTVRLSRQDIVQHFRGGVPAESRCAEYRIPADPVGVTNTEAAPEEVVVTVKNVDDVSNTVGDSWILTHIPCYLSLAISLADLLRAPLTPPEFAECLYAMLLELDVRFAVGTARRAIAQRNLRHYRQHQHQPQNLASDACSSSKSAGDAGGSLVSGGAGAGAGGPATGIGGVGVGAALGGIGSFLQGTWDAGNGVKYVYLNTEHSAYMIPGEVRYEELIVPLCAQLMVAYRRLGDYHAANNEEFVKRALSIDRRLQCVFFSVISKELGKIAHAKLLQQTLLLSTDGLFAGFAGTHSNAHSLLQGLVHRPSVRTKSAQEVGATKRNYGGGLRESPSTDFEEQEEEDDGESAAT